jgi:hypothetical protein
MEPSNEPQGDLVQELAETELNEGATAALLDELQKDFDRIRRQKSRPTGGVDGTTMLNLCFVNDEHYAEYAKGILSLEAEDKNKPRLVFNLITPRMNKLLGRLSAFNAPFKARPNKQDPQALQDAEIVDRALVALDEKLDEPSKLRERLFWLLVAGTAFEYIPWVPNATIEPNPQFDGAELLYKWASPQGEQVVKETDKEAIIQGGLGVEEQFEIYEEIEMVGEVGSIVLPNFNVFIDHSVRSIESLPPDAWVHIAIPRTVGWVKENFEVDVEPQKEISLTNAKISAMSAEATGGVYLKDLIPLVQGSMDDTDPPSVLVVESYQATSNKNPHGKFVCWIPKQKILHEAENPYEDIPLVDLHFSPVTTSFWTKSYITPLIPPQRFINKRMNQLAEQANASIYSNILLGPGLTEADVPADFPGVIQGGLSENGTPNVARMLPPEIPMWFLQSIELAVKMFNDAAGGADLMEESKFPGQLRGPMAVPMLQEILDTQWGPLFSHLGERIARIKQQRLNRMRQFYPPLRTMHYTDKTQKDEVLTFHAEKILRAGTNFSITVERGAILPELRALREARLSERLKGPLSILYMDERTRTLDKSKIAADLQFGDTGREGRETKYRKLAKELIDMMWKAEQVPPVQPFYDHKVMLDELEDTMATTEFLKASQPVQQIFADRWQQHAMFLQQEAQQQQMAMQSGMIHNAVAQATQQAAAQAASDAVTEAQHQQQAQDRQPTDQYLASAQGRSGGGPPQGRPQPQRFNQPGPGKPAQKSRKITVEEKNG